MKKVKVEIGDLLLSPTGTIFGIVLGGRKPSANTLHTVAWFDFNTDKYYLHEVDTFLVEHDKKEFLEWSKGLL
jgi:hypothetical protein